MGINKAAILFGFLIVLLLLLQHRLWLGDGGVQELHALRTEIQTLSQRVAEMKERNLALTAEVKDLKHGHEAIEERARRDLGMVKEGETFFQIIPSP